MNLLATAWRPRTLLIIGALGFAAQLLVLLCSAGTNDIVVWEAFGRFIRERGLGKLYGVEVAQFNHPPLMGLLALGCYRISTASSIPFPIVFKSVPVLANLATAWLLWSIAAKSEGRGPATRFFAHYAWSLCPLLVGAYHGNTDTICVFLCFLAATLAMGERPGLAGLALAAAINVKIIAVLVAIPILAGLRTFAAVRRFAWSSALAAIPFGIAMFWAGPALIDRIFHYRSFPELWGVSFLLQLAGRLPGVGDAVVEPLNAAYRAQGALVMAAGIVAVSVYGWRRNLDSLRLAGAGFAVFLLLAPGFGLQYTVYPAPFLYAVSRRWGTLYSLVAGLFLISVYAHFLIDRWPLTSLHQPFPSSLAVGGLVCWLLLLAGLHRCLHPTGSEASTLGPDAAPEAAN